MSYRFYAGAVKLRPMTDDEFQQWHGRAVEAYANDIARATGSSIEAARERVRVQDAQLLPDGFATADTWLMMICDDSDTVAGTLWIGPTAFADATRVAAGLARAGFTAAKLETDATASFEKIEPGWRMTRMALRVVGDVPGIDQAAFRT